MEQAAGVQVSGRRTAIPRSLWFQMAIPHTCYQLNSELPKAAAGPQDGSGHTRSYPLTNGSALNTLSSNIEPEACA
jgi:hypothetical protein